MQATVLIDNRPHPLKTSLEVEHGLSFYLEMDGKKVLLDVGASDKFLTNANRLGIDICDVDYLVLSHAHKDHTGGLAYFLQNNSKAQIYLSSHINNGGYFSTRHGMKRDISIDYELIDKYKERFNWVSENTTITPSIILISHIPVKYELPKANRTLLAGDTLDNFNHEIALLLTTDNQTVVFSSCTHLGLLNTLEACGKRDISTFIGGLHLVDSDCINTFETEEEIEAITQTIQNDYPDLQIYTGHCTGEQTLQLLSKRLSTQFHSFHTGFEWRI